MSESGELIAPGELASELPPELTVLDQEGRSFEVVFNSDSIIINGRSRQLSPDEQYISEIFSEFPGHSILREEFLQAGFRENLGMGARESRLTRAMLSFRTKVNGLAEGALLTKELYDGNRVVYAFGVDVSY